MTTFSKIRWGDGLSVVDEGAGVITVSSGGGGGAAAPGYGTTLPATPVDGQEHILVDSTTTPTYQWRFRYNAGSSSPYKWEFVGGSPMTAYYGATEPIGTIGSWFGASPTLLLPRAGSYLVQFSACYFIGANPALVWLGLWDGAFVANTQYGMTQPAGGVASVGMADVPYTATSPSVLIANAYWVNAAGVQVGQRYLTARPVRVA